MLDGTQKIRWLKKESKEDPGKRENSLPHTEKREANKGEAGQSKRTLAEKRYSK